MAVDVIASAGTAADVIARTTALIPRLRERASAAEELREMPTASVADLKRAGTARLLQPARFGGCEAPLGSVIEALSAVATGCGSTAWIMAQHVSHNYMLAQWAPEAQETVWGDDPTRFVSGIFIPGCGRGRKTAGGYVLSGRWPFVSGINTCDWCLFSAYTDDGDDCETDLHYALPRGQIQIVDTWHAIGLQGSSSNDVVVSEVFAPEHMTLSIDYLKGGPTPGNEGAGSPLYRIPSYAIFGTFIGAACLGIAESALEIYLARARDRVALMSRRSVDQYMTQHVKVADAACSIATARRVLLEVCADADDIARRHGLPDAEQRAQYRAQAAFAGRLLKNAVDLLWEAGGGSGVYAKNPMSRIYRDMSAASCHFTQNWDVNGSTYGRVLMGLSLDNPSL